MHSISTFLPSIVATLANKATQGDQCEALTPDKGMEQGFKNNTEMVLLFNAFNLITVICMCALKSNL